MPKLFSFCLLFLSVTVFAGYDANVKRKILEVSLYTDGDYIYVKLENPPEHPTCNNAYFVIPDTVPENRRNMLLSRLLSAYASNESVNIGYDSVGNCAFGYVRIHRVG